jgi:hypothetical protein
MKEKDTYKHDKITPTADLISYFRIFSDTPYTKEIAKMTNAKETAKRILGEHFKDSMYLAVMSEVRYKRIDIHAKEYKNILEVAVGRSPRDLIFTEDPKVNYVATDLPESLKQHQLVMQELINRHKLNRPNLHFVPANALNLEELEKASDILPKNEPLAIISEGFMVYLSKEEKNIFLGNIRSLLSKRDGCLITSDVIYTKKSMARSRGILESIASSSGRDMRDFSFDDVEDAKNFFSAAGFDCDTFADNVDVVSVEELKLENNPDSQRFLSYPIWVLTPKK